MDLLVTRARSAPDRNELVNYATATPLAASAAAGGLAFTGANVGWEVLLGLTVMAVGTTLVRLTRTRRLKD